jgi:hypothetical protein
VRKKVMRIDGEKTIFGEDIKSPEQFIEDICDRVNGVFGKVEEFEDERMQLGILFGFLNGLAGRLNRVCER